MQPLASALSRAEDDDSAVGRAMLGHQVLVQGGQLPGAIHLAEQLLDAAGGLGLGLCRVRAGRRARVCAGCNRQSLPEKGEA